MVVTKKSLFCVCQKQRQNMRSNCNKMERGLYECRNT